MYPYPPFSSWATCAFGVYFSSCCFILDASFPMDSVGMGARCVKHSSEGRDVQIKRTAIWAKRLPTSPMTALLQKSLFPRWNEKLAP